MPVKIYWMRGRNLGLALIFLSLVGFIQVIFIIIAQYGLQIGSQEIVILVPLGVTIALFYAVIVVFESWANITKYREARPFSQKKSKTIRFLQRYNWILLRPVGVIILGFMILFAITLGITQGLDQSLRYVIAENVGAIGGLLLATYIESAAQRKIR